MIKKMAMICALFLVAVWPALAQTPPPVNPIQAAIDAAAPGDVVEVPAGAYVGALTLKNGVILKGAGAESTVIDGAGAETVIKGAADAALIGFTIRNGRTAVDNDGRFIGVFECVITDYTLFGILVNHGAAAIANNWVDGKGQGNGIGCISANPYIGNNVIVSNAVGIRATLNYIPTVADNVFAFNTLAILVDGGAEVVLRGNIFDGNGENIRGQAFGADDRVAAVDLARINLPRGGSLESYKGLLGAVREAAVAMHPIVIYDLNHPIGQFLVTTLFPWATFTVASATKDTVIAEYDAYDGLTTARLNAEYVRPNNERPAVAVINSEIKAQGLDRYVLDNLYVHPGSYYYAPDGRLVFQRDTNFSRIQIVTLAGWKVAELNYPAEIVQNGDRQIVKINDVGHTSIKLVMERN